AAEGMWDIVMAASMRASTRTRRPASGQDGSTPGVFRDRGKSTTGRRDRAQVVVIAYETGLVQPGWATSGGHAALCGSCARCGRGQDGHAGGEPAAT
ncbi:MAG: hypothetical protein ACRDNW_20030, partial [Trebonia sp.]